MGAKSRQDYIPIDVKRNVYQKLQALAESEKLSLRQYVNDLLTMSVEKNEFLQRYAPHLSKWGVQDNVLLIRDAKLNKTAEIYLRESHLFCALDERDDCVHIHFALLLPELAMVISKATTPVEIYSTRLQRKVKVDYKDGRLHCPDCDSFDCEHAQAINEEKRLKGSS
ncbi:MAG: hypothetical protein QXJ74_05300 [Nitrososphaera sp.]